MALILIVDDNVVNQTLMQAIVRSLGHQTHIATHGADALKMAATAIFDVVFMDLMMPVMDGYEATARLRAHPLYAQVPIIAVSADATAHSRQRAEAAGITHFIAKPFTKKEIAEQLTRYLGG